MVINPVPHDESLHLSASSISTMMECPRQFLYQYIQGHVPQDTSSALVLGSAIHEALAYFYNTMMQSDSEPSLTELVAVAAVAMESPQKAPIAFRKGESMATLQEQARDMLRAFLETGYRPRYLLAVEHRFTIPLTHPHPSLILPKHRSWRCCSCGYRSLCASQD